jgi:hypothetical protein
MLKTEFYIVISDKETGKDKIFLPFISSVEINSARVDITETAEIRFPQKTYLQNKKVLDYIQVNDEVKIYLGYLKYALSLEFSGFIKTITPGTETVLKCENLAFKFKKLPIEKKTFKNAKLSEILEYYYKDPINFIDTDVGTWIINKNVTFIKLLNELKNKFSFYAYFQGDKLFVNYDLVKEAERTILADVERNVVLNGIKIKSLDKTDFSPFVHGISEQADGSKIELYSKYNDLGDIIVETIKPEEGAENLFEIPGLSEEALSDLIKTRLENLYQTGGTGTVLTFGFPSVIHGDKVEIRNSKTLDENGVYQITGIKKTLTVANGFKQTISVGKKLSN